MNTRMVGSGEPTLVLAHGFGTGQYIWDNLLPKLNQKNRVMVFDWPFSCFVDPPVIYDTVKYSCFHGFAADLIALLDKMGLKDVVFVGHSMSGMIGCIASIERPDLFSQIVLIGASPRYINGEGYKGGFEIEQVNSLLANMETNFESWVNSFALLIAGTENHIIAEKFKSSLQRMNPSVALALARVIFFGDYRDMLGLVEVRCTIVQGHNDMAVPVSVGQYMKGKMKGVTTVEIIDSDGHFPQFTAHHRLLEILDRVIDNRS